MAGLGRKRVELDHTHTDSVKISDAVWKAHWTRDAGSPGLGTGHIYSPCPVFYIAQVESREQEASEHFVLSVKPE